MVSGVTLPRPDAKCDASVIERNLELSRKLKVNGTPAIVFEDGTRAPGALSADQLEQRLQSIKAGTAKS